MGQDPTMVTLRERVRVVKTDLDNPEKPPEIIEQETVTKISLDEAAILGFVPGQGFDGPPAPVEGARVGGE
jgi:hypothetical protein